MLFIFAVFFFLWFLRILHGMLRRAEGEEETGLPSVALAGGLALVALKLVGCRLRLTTRRLWTVSTTSRRMLRVAVPLRLQRRRGSTDSCELHGSAPYGRFAEVASLVRPDGSTHPAAPLSHPTGLLTGTALVRYGCCTYARRWRWVYRRPSQIHRTLVGPRTGAPYSPSCRERTFSKTHRVREHKKSRG